jgi:hypothetical protein
MELDGDLEMYENVLNNPSGSIDRAAILNEIQETKIKIQEPYFDDIRNLYTSKVFKTNSERKAQTIKWYSFTSNANSVRYLAENLQKLDRYYMVYAVASNLTHSSRLLSDTIYMREGMLYIRRIRDIEGIDDVAKAIITLSTEAVQLVSKGLLYHDRFAYLQARDEFNRRYRSKYRIVSS